MSTRILSGIYRIRNLLDGKVYVGSAVNIRDRWRRHRERLTKGVNCSPHLQAAWKKYGEAAFVFDLIEVVERKEDLIAREQIHLDALFAAGHHYNTSPTAGSPLGVKHTEATRAKRRAYRASAETRAKLSLAHVGRVIPAEIRAKMSLAKKSRPMSAENRAKIAARSKGKTPSLEARAKMSLAKKGRPLLAEHRVKLSLAHKASARAVKQRESMSAANKGRPWTKERRENFSWSDEARAKVAIALKGNTHTKGRKLSDEHRKKISAAGTGRKHTEQTRAKMAVARKAFWARKGRGTI